MAEIVVLSEFLFEMNVFIKKKLLVGFDEMIDLNRLCNHRQKHNFYSEINPAKAKTGTLTTST